MSARMETGPANPFSGKIVGILLGIMVFSLAAVLVLQGWSPEMRKRDEAAQHPFSTSALGYNGLVQFLESQAYPVSVSRQPLLITKRTDGLMIITLSDSHSLRALEETQPTNVTLIVLPKWQGERDMFTGNRWRATELIESHISGYVLDGIDTLSSYAATTNDTTLTRIAVPSTFIAPWGDAKFDPDVTVQVLRSTTLQPVIYNGDNILLARLPYDDTYILSDPDVLNTFGLAKQTNAVLAMQIIDYLRTYEDEPIYLDATLHGFALSQNLWRMMFDVPFIGATLIAAASAFLLGWAALVRFGPSIREGRAIALGKQALADNSAGLFIMARREKDMAPGYLNFLRRRVARELNVPKTMTDTEITQLFDKLGTETQSGKTFSQIEAGLQAPASSRDDLMNKVRTLFRWRRDILRRAMHERQ